MRLRRILLGTALVAYSLKLTGFCFEQLRYLSNEELVIKALTYVGDNATLQERVFGERQAKDYFARHPECCRVRWGSSWIDGYFLNALFGRRFFDVGIVLPRLEMHGNSGKFYHFNVIIECCGDLITDTHGIEGDQPPPPR